MSKLSAAMVVVLVTLAVVVGIDQVFGSHKQPESQPSLKVEQGIYDPDAVLFAQNEIQSELDKGTFLDRKSLGLSYLAYLAEGARCFPDRVDSFRVQMLLNQTQPVMEGALRLTEEQNKSLTRINLALGTEQPPSPYIGLGQVSAAAMNPDGTSKSSPVETSCR